MASKNQRKIGNSNYDRIIVDRSHRGGEEKSVLRHGKEHEDSVQDSLNEVHRDYIKLEKDIEERTADLSEHSLQEQIAQWDQESVKKIHESTDTIRRKLDITTQNRIRQLEEKLENLEERLGKDGEDVVPIKVDRPSPVHPDPQDPNSSHYTDKTDSHPDISDVKHPNIGGDNPIVHQPNPRFSSRSDTDSSINPIENPSSSNKKKKASSGKYKYVIEECDEPHWIVFGIVSKARNPEKKRTFYGWVGENRVYQGNNEYTKNLGGYQNDFHPNDKYTLTVDTEKSEIHLKNERTDRDYPLKVDPERCPQPWELVSS